MYSLSLPTAQETLVHAIREHGQLTPISKKPVLRFGNTNSRVNLYLDHDYATGTPCVLAQLADSGEVEHRVLTERDCAEWLELIETVLILGRLT